MSLETKDLIEGCRRQPLFVACGALSLVLLVLLYFRFGAPSELQTKLEESEKLLTRLSNNVKYSAQLDVQFKELRDANTAIQEGALRPGELARNQQVFFRLEQDTGVKILEIRQQTSTASASAVPPAKGKAPAATTLYTPVVYVLTLQGDYGQLMNFLKRLEQGETLARVSSALFAQPVEGAQTLNITVELLGLRS